ADGVARRVRRRRAVNSSGRWRRAEPGASVRDNVLTTGRPGIFSQATIASQLPHPMNRTRLPTLALAAAALLLAGLVSAGPAPEARALAPLALPHGRLRPPANPTHFRFVVGGDN